MSCDKKKTEKCLKKSNILVYKTPIGEKTERKSQSCHRNPKVPICHPEAKRIRVCTGAELRKMCPPPECPKKELRRRRFGILRFLGFGMKAAVAAACVYVTYDMGVWGSTEETQDMYRNACAIFGRPQAKKRDNTKWDPPSCQAESELFRKPPFNPHGDCEEPPITVHGTALKFQHYWNSAVKKIFSGIAGFPYNLTNSSGTKSESDSKKEKCEPGKCECVPYEKLDPEEQETIKNRYK